MSQYFVSIRKRDNILGEPFWKYLEVQPAGWLTSLVYYRSDLPCGRKIIDCGAWTYKGEDVPRIGKDLVTTEWATQKYASMAQVGDFVVAPDHIPLPGTDIASRVRYNHNSAEEFITSVDAGLTAMATVHGSVEDRMEQATHYHALGYTAIAIGGVASAAARGVRKADIVEIVEKIRSVVPRVWLHVFGVSAPAYVREWERIGVQSFDGASHFLYAFTNGVFFTQRGEKLIRNRAARPGAEPSVAECECYACATLRDAGEDTRRYGNNARNMGRAAHNLNMLMRAQREAIA